MHGSYLKDNKAELSGEVDVHTRPTIARLGRQTRTSEPRRTLSRFQPDHRHANRFRAAGKGPTRLALDNIIAVIGGIVFEDLLSFAWGHIVPGDMPDIWIILIEARP